MPGTVRLGSLGAIFAPKQRRGCLMSWPITPRRLTAVFTVCLLVPVSLRAQTLEPHESDSLDPGSRAPINSERKPDLARTGELITKYTNQFRSRNQRDELKVNPQL